MLTLEQIIALLQTKFAGMRKDGLEQLAKVIRLNATNEDEVKALVERYTPEQVTEFITDWRKDVDKEVNNGVKTAETNFKKKYKVTEDSETNLDKDSVVEPEKDTPTDITAIIQAAIKPLTDEISALKSGNVTATRSELLNSKLSTAPQAFKDRVLRDYNRMSFENEEAFNGYISELEVDLTNYTQEVNNQSLSAFGRPVVSGSDNNTVSTAVEQYVKESQAGKGEGVLGGKTL